MGVKGLYSFLKRYRHEKALSSFAGMQPTLRIGIDAMSLLYKYKSAWKEIYPVLTTLQDQGHKTLFIFDGKPPAEKEVEVRERRDARQDAATQAALLRSQLATSTFGVLERQILEESIHRLDLQGWHMTRDIRHAFQQGLWDMKIPYVKANFEADAVLVDMVAAEKLDVVLSTDMDFLLSNVPRLWIPQRRPCGEFFVEEIQLNEVLQGEGMTAEQLTDAGILCGVEPLRGRVQVYPHTAFSWVRYYGSIEAILAGKVNHPHLATFKTDPDCIASTRNHFAPQAPWDARIRTDHLERVRTLLEVF